MRSQFLIITVFDGYLFVSLYTQCNRMQNIELEVEIYGCLVNSGDRKIDW